MSGNDAPLTFYDQEKLDPTVRDAAISAANALLAERGISIAAAIRAYQAELLLADELDGAELTEEDFQTHGSSLRACDAYHDARDAASAEIARLDPARADFKILFTLAV